MQHTPFVSVYNVLHGTSTADRVCVDTHSQNMIRTKSGNTHEVVNPATGEPLFIISDSVHLFKKLRNQLLASYEPGDGRGSRSMQWQGHGLYWSHILTLYSLERSRPLEQSPYPVRVLDHLACRGRSLNFGAAP